MKEKLITAALAVFILGVIAIWVWYEYSLWHECRATNSFMYCMRVLGK